ncbi:DUF3139 domain-containing protein [Effusibacillus consociatus]|uniref:DUF3139 domain-containing protein n=1 Tax=Effusibacillus consociatus TaxID=1117041 RepID=A0ABV9Q4L2_9BACL
METNRKFLIVIPFLLLLILILSGYLWYNGSPWGNKHDKELMIKFLNEKYPSHSYTIVREGYNVKKGEYELVVIFKDNPSTEHFYAIRNNELVEVRKSP